MGPLDVLTIELARIREKIAVLQIEEAQLHRMIVEIAGQRPLQFEEPNTQEASGTAREAPGASSSVDATSGTASASPSPEPEPEPEQPKPVRRSSNAWNEWEDQLIRDRWPDGGYEAVRERLSHRSQGATYQRAKVLGVKRDEGWKNKPRAKEQAPAAPKTDDPPRKLSFAQQLERVSRGEVGIGPAFKPTRAAPDATLGGVVGPID